MKYIFFDLDGTLIDSAHIFVESFNELTGWIPGHTPLDKEHFKQTPIEDLIKKYHIPKILIPIGLKIMRHKFTTKAHTATVFPGIIELLQSLHEKTEIGLLTTSNKKYVDIVFEKNNLSPYFTHVIHTASLFKKTDNIFSYAKKHTINPKDIIMISDEERDIKNFNNYQIPIIAVSWGFDSRDLLSSLHPDTIVDSVEELKKTLFTLLDT